MPLPARVATARPLPGPALTRRLCAMVTATGLALALYAGHARADDTADVTRLMHSGQYAEALSKADAFLARKPRDPQMRFLKGVILTEQNKTNEAIGVFTKLTEDYPELPEPYNNLAVLYAGAGQYEKARVALDKAIRTNPTYATAYENLGDIHAKLASEAYDKALQLDSSNSGAKSKLTLVRTLVGGASIAGAGKAGGALAAPAAPAAAATVKAPAAAPIPPLAKAEPPKTEARPPVPAKPEAKVDVKPQTKADVKPQPKAEVKAETKADARPDSKAAAENGEKDEIVSAVQGWAHAWSARDVKGYLGYYSADFDTPKGMSRKAWSEERESRIAGKRNISVQVESPQVAINGNVATVKFRQHYVSDRLKTSSRKTLVLVKNHGKWQIRQEKTGG